MIAWTSNKTSNQYANARHRTDLPLIRLRDQKAEGKMRGSGRRCRWKTSPESEMREREAGRDRQSVNLTWIRGPGRKNHRREHHGTGEKGEKERDGGNYFRFRALGIGYTFSPRVWLGEVVVTASFLHCHGQPVVTWLFRRPRPDLRWPRPCGKFTIDWFSGWLSTGSVRLSICHFTLTFDTDR